MDTTLPQGFEALEPFVARFAVSGTANRARLRGEVSAAERQAFYDAAIGLVPGALDHLDTRPLGSLSAPEQRLMDLALTFAHIALAVEVQGPDEERHTALRETMRIVRSPADA